MLSESELRSARQSLAQIIFDSGFTSEITSRTVSKITESSFNIGGSMGATYRKGGGLTLWNKGQRSAGKRFKLSELVELEKKLAHEFNRIWLGWVN